MSRFSDRLGFAILAAALGLGGQAAQSQTLLAQSRAQSQATPLGYWTPGWPVGFSGNAPSQGSDTFGNFPGFTAVDTGGGRFSTTRYNFPNGWFIGSEAGGLGFGMNGFGSSGALGGLHYEGTQFGYNFQNSPVTIYGGVDTLKYDPGIGSAFGPFDTTSGTVGGYSAHAGIEFRPTSNLSLSLGASFTQQQSNLVDSDINSTLPPGASPLAFGGRR